MSIYGILSRAPKILKNGNREHDFLCYFFEINQINQPYTSKLQKKIHFTNVSTHIIKEYSKHNPEGCVLFWDDKTRTILCISKFT